jgi:hypothetical protein
MKPAIRPVPSGGFVSKETPQAHRGKLQVSFLVVAALSLVLAGCAKTLPTTYGAEPSPEPTLTMPSVAPTTVAPTSTPTVKPKPVDPFDTLSASAKKEFKGCLTKKVGPNSSGKCAKLVIKKLKAAGFYPWGSASSINVAGANAILNYQRSRGIKATATTTKETWVALATKAAAVPQTLPKKCTTTKLILCVDQAHRKLFWIKKGKVVKTFKIRVGGWNYHPKTKKWKVFATANGTWKVYDKQVNPASENYGSGAMPYSTMFYPDMYVHYSPGFHADGYTKSSHGCVNIGNLSQAQWIFSHTPIGTPVYIYSLKAAKVTTPSVPSSQPSGSSGTTPSATPTS